MLDCAICGKRDFKTHENYKRHHRTVHNVHVLETPIIKPVNTSGRSKAQIVEEMENFIRQMFSDAFVPSPLIGYGE